MRNKVKELGITLIALVITIIILLILAGVVINMATSGTGLFEKAKEATNLTELKQREENETLSTYESIIDQYLTGNTGNWKIDESTGTITSNTGKTVKIGDYVSYTVDTVDTSSSSTNAAYNQLRSDLTTYSGYLLYKRGSEDHQDNFKWRILDVKDGKIRLISETPTSSTLKFKGYNGYNNAVYLLDEVCRTLYNNSTFASKVESLKFEDIKSHVIDTSMEAIGPSSTTGKAYPLILEQEEGQTITRTGMTQPSQRIGLSVQNSLINQTEKLETSTSLASLTNTLFIKNIEDTNWKNSKYINLFIKDEAGEYYDYYWLSSRMVYTREDKVIYGISFMNPATNPNLNFATMYDSSEETIDYNIFYLRPVVTLKADALLTTGSGTKDDAWKISF